MDDIGYSYWTLRQWCGGIIIAQMVSPGHVLHYTSVYWASSMQQKAYCGAPYTREGESLGNHDFYDWPYNHIYPYSAARHIVP